jgi:deoxyribodipyrimidine photo-lyase
VKTALYWFRNDLRISDNIGLTEACKNDRVIAVYCFNPENLKPSEFGFPKIGRYRAKFLIESLLDLGNELRKLNISLLVYNDKPEVIIPDLADQFHISDMYLQHEWTRDETKEIDAVKQNIGESIVWHKIQDGFLFHPEDIPYTSEKVIPEVFTEFRKRCEKTVRVRKPLPKPTPKNSSNLLDTSNSIFTLNDLGFESLPLDSRSAFPFEGGTSAAWERIENYFWRDQRLSYYKHTRNGMVGTEYSSKLSPWLANGSISAREIYHEVIRYESTVVKNQDTYWLIFELIWRDYFRYISLKHGNTIFLEGGIRKNHTRLKKDVTIWERWTQGQTKNDFINANMIELLHTGWMSNRGRQNVASYWVRHLKQDWRIGAAWFEYLLIDYDVHSNWCNWMYNSGVGNDPRDRTFNPDLQASRYDADGKFRKLWLQASLFDSNAEI